MRLISQNQRLLWGISLLPALFLVNACGAGQGNTTQNQKLIPTDWNNRWWLQKTSRALRGGEPLSESETPCILLSSGREQVVDQFLEDPRFADTVLDFSLMFIGFKQNLIKTKKDGYLPAAYQYPQAMLASKEVASRGDFFKIFDLSQKIYVSPLKRPIFTDETNSSISDAELREKVFSAIQTDLSGLRELAISRPADTDSICTGLKAHLLHFIDVDSLRITGEIPYQIYYSEEYYGGPTQYCDARPPNAYDFAQAFARIREKNDILFNFLRPLDRANYQPRTVSEIRSFDYKSVVPSFDYNAFKPDVISRALQNSSTNYNRKRAAYVLKRFLCDDLTPINVENPSAHVGDIHGTNPSCFACHYKLDPMAGFFRYYGGAFTSFENRTSISFDDNASMPVAEYLKSWTPGPDAAHPLNVGYIRSTQNTNQNFYGSGLDELLGFLKTAPEARRCLMKRAYEYLVSPDQTIDGEYLDFLTEQFNQVNASSGSVAALKNSFKTIVLGDAFTTQNANRDECYDRKPGGSAQTGVPCRVASILAKNCTSCHSSLSGSGKLDLSHWDEISADAGGFPHVRRNGSLFAAKTTLQQMLDRLSTTDSDARMPYLSDMPSQDRQQLYTWVNQQLNRSKK